MNPKDKNNLEKLIKRLQYKTNGKYNWKILAKLGNKIVTKLVDNSLNHLCYNKFFSYFDCLKLLEDIKVGKDSLLRKKLNSLFLGRALELYMIKRNVSENALNKKYPEPLFNFDQSNNFTCDNDKKDNNVKYYLLKDGKGDYLVNLNLGDMDVGSHLHLTSDKLNARKFYTKNQLKTYLYNVKVVLPKSNLKIVSIKNKIKPKPEQNL